MLRDGRAMSAGQYGGATGPRTQEGRRTEAEQRLVAAAAEMVGEMGPAASRWPTSANGRATAAAWPHTTSAPRAR